jgi:hypothetical protein
MLIMIKKYWTENIYVKYHTKPLVINILGTYNRNE